MKVPARSGVPIAAATAGLVLLVVLIGTRGAPRIAERRLERPVGATGSGLANDLREVGRAAFSPGAEHVRGAGEAEAPEAGPGEDVLLGLVVEEGTGRPLEGAHVEARLPPPDDVLGRGEDPFERASPVAEARSDAEGRFAIPVAGIDDLELVVLHEGHGLARHDWKRGDGEVVLELAASARLHGSVRAEGTGEPMAGVSLRLWDPGLPGLAFLETTDATGAYEFRSAPAGVFFLAAESATGRSPSWIQVALRPGLDVERDFVIAPGTAIEGTVVDGASGAPIPGARVGFGSSFAKGARATELGSYRLEGGAGVLHDTVFVEAPGYGPAWRTVPEGASSARMDFALERAAEVRGRVVDRDGAPLAGVCVGCVLARSARSPSPRLPRTTTGMDGEFRLPGLSQGVRYVVVARGRGYGIQSYALPALAGGPLDLRDLVLTPAAVVRGRVETESGVPVVECPVVLGGCNSDVGRFLGPGETPRVDSHVRLRRTRTDQDGRFAFQDVPRGEFTLTARLSYAATAVLPLSTAVRELEDATLVLPDTLDVSGRVETEVGEPLPGVTVLASTTCGEMRPLGSGSTGEMGRFTIRGLPAVVVQLDLELDSYRFLHPGSPLVADRPTLVDAGASDVRLVVRHGVTVSGRVLHEDGRPAAGLQVLVLHPESVLQAIASSSTDEGGGFRVHVPEGLRMRLSVRDGNGDELSFTLPEATAGAPPGTITSERRCITVRLASER